MALKYRIANRILTAAANFLFDAQLTDEATAYKAFRVSVLRELRLDCQRFEFCPEVTAKLRRLKYRIHEVPITYNAQAFAEGKKNSIPRRPRGFVDFAEVSRRDW